MITQTQGKIYLAEQRRCVNLSWYRSFQTFFFHQDPVKNKDPFGSIQRFEENSLAAGKTIALEKADNETLLLLPVAGSLEFAGENGFIRFLSPGDVQVIHGSRKENFQLINPYGLESIHFLQIGISSGKSLTGELVHSFDTEKRNELTLITDSPEIRLHIGKYTGRHEGRLELSNPQNGIFSFVVQGAFEVNNRLLQPKDALALWDFEELEFEALSNDAILLILETPLYLMNSAVYL